MAKWVFQIDSNGYQNASQILLEGGFEILRQDIFTTMSFHEMVTVR
jgi:hypothetical protein